MAGVAQFFDRERAELEQVLSSPSFRKAPKLSRILEYVCERYFDGTAANLKQYNIAVEALERDPGFDPHVDAIVRVDLHLLRKRLESYYAGVGKEHEVQIVLPAGQYVPQFVNRDARACDSPDAARGNSRFVVPTDPLDVSNQKNDGISSKRQEVVPHAGEVAVSNWYRRRRTWLTSAASGIFGLAIGLTSILVLSHNAKSAIRIISGQSIPFASVGGTFLSGLAFGGAPDTYSEGIRILCGADHDFIDSAGFRWHADQYFTGGSTFYRPNEVIRGFPDQAMFATGRSGNFHYDIPVRSGAYEVHLLFAETEPGVFDGMRPNSFTIGTTTEHIDVISEAGGADTATMRVYANIRPSKDGKIHVNFFSGSGFLNAVEILPEKEDHPSPIRVSTLPGIYTDLAGRHWLSDRYFAGGRNINHDVSLRADPPLLTHERYGDFSYAIPVAKGFSYRLTLVMAERYWGPQNSGHGGPGSRVFNVRCNGTNLLRNFDLFTEQRAAHALAIHFDHLQPGPSGKLKIDFLPVVNYAVVNALEVEPE